MQCVGAVKGLSDDIAWLSVPVFGFLLLLLFFNQNQPFTIKQVGLKCVAFLSRYSFHVWLYLQLTCHVRLHSHLLIVARLNRGS